MLRDNHRFSIICVCLMMLSSPCFASETPAKAEVTKSLSAQKAKQENCWLDAGKTYRIDPWLLYSIAQHESGLKAHIVSKPNSDGSRDIGMMQINSSWLPSLKKMGFKERDLFDACTNIKIGAWILSGSIARLGNSWRSVGAYNAGEKLTLKRERLRAKYARNIYSLYNRNTQFRLPQATAQASTN